MSVRCKVCCEVRTALSNYYLLHQIFGQYTVMRGDVIALNIYIHVTSQRVSRYLRLPAVVIAHHQALMIVDDSGRRVAGATGTAKVTQTPTSSTTAGGSAASVSDGLVRHQSFLHPFLLFHPSVLEPYFHLRFVEL